MSASARSMSSSAASAAPGALRSSITERLPRIMTSWRRARFRPRSAEAGRSTTRTSAPRSASSIPQNGAGPIASNSRTRIPLRGPPAFFSPRTCSRSTRFPYSAVMAARYPERIVCLTEETTETLYLLGEERRIVGISGYTVRPARARREKPRVSAFLSAKTDRILALPPDPVLGFSDLQADIARELAKAGLSVVLFNQRSVQQILDMILMLAAMVGAAERGARLVAELEEGLSGIRRSADDFPFRPRVYFEEWDEPMISGIRWVSELIAIAGGEDVLEDLSRSAAASGRIHDGARVVAARPDVILASWCCKKFRPERVRSEEGWDAIPAVREGRLFEVKSADILQPGPAALTDGVRRVHEILRDSVSRAPRTRP